MKRKDSTFSPENGKLQIYLDSNDYSAHEIARVYFKVMSLDKRAIIDMAGQGPLDESVATPSMGHTSMSVPPFYQAVQAEPFTPPTY